MPQRDSFLYLDLLKNIQEKGCNKQDSEKIALSLIYHMDMYQACEGCDATVLNVNGRVPDEGALIEAALCFGRGKPVVTYNSDYRSLIKGKDNPLISGLTGFRIIDKLVDIPKELKKLEDIQETEFSKMMKNARLLFNDYTQDKTDLGYLVELGKNIF